MDWASGVGRSVGEGKQKSTLSPHIVKDMVSIRTSNTASTVTRNKRPKMRETERSSSVSRMMKSPRELAHLDWNFLQNACRLPGGAIC